MTLDEMSSFICSKVGKLDANSVAICNGFINRRYQMIYDAELWHDTRVGASLTTVVGQNTITLPAIMDRAITVRLGFSPSGGIQQTLLEPTTTSFILEIDPALLDAIGRPRYYADFFDNTDKVHKLRLFPSPNEILGVFIHGKRVWMPLAGADTPSIRNIDNCLIAFATGDMLQYTRQYGKAKELIDEASAHLEVMRKIEREQANKPRTASALTVYGDSLGEMTDAVSSRIGDWTPQANIVIREYLRRCYQRLYNMRFWVESTVIARMARDVSEVILPDYFDRVVSVRVEKNPMELVPAEQSLYFQINPNLFDQVGPPVAFSTLTPVAVRTLPPQNEQLAFVSDNVDDRALVSVRGETGGVVVYEEFRLKGTTEAVTKYTYDRPLTIAKDETNGTITIRGFVSRAFLQELRPLLREKKHVRIWLQPAPDNQTDAQILILGKRTIDNLRSDVDTPMIRGMGDVLIHETVGEMFARIGNKDGATEAKTMAARALQSLISQESEQSSVGQRIVPFVDPTADYWDDWAFIAK
jgi:hypothetical protein